MSICKSNCQSCKTQHIKGRKTQSCKNSKHDYHDKMQNVGLMTKYETAQRSKKMKNDEVSSRMSDGRQSRIQNPEMMLPQGKARAQVPQVPADDHRSPLDQQRTIQSDQPSVHHPEDSLAEPSITMSIPSPVKNHSTG